MNRTPSLVGRRKKKTRLLQFSVFCLPSLFHRGAQVLSSLNARHRHAIVSDCNTLIIVNENQRGNG